MLNLPVADPQASATTPGAGSSGFTAGSVAFADATGALNEDNANLFWDDTNNFLGIGTAATPVSPLHVASSMSPAAGSTASIVTLAGTIVEAAAGNHALLAGMYINPPAVTVGGATVTNTATVYVAGAMNAVVTGSNYAVWVASGTSRFDGVVLTGAGAVGAPGLAVGELTTGLYQTGAGATSAIHFATNGVIRASMEAGGGGNFTAYGQVRSNLIGTALYAPSGGAQVLGSTGYDSTSGIPLVVGPTNATGVAISKVGGVSTMLGTMTHTYSAIGTAQTVVHSIVNATPAALGAQQYSGMFELGGQGWETNVGSSMAVKAAWQLRPIQGAAAPTWQLDLLSSINGAAYGASGFYIGNFGAIQCAAASAVGAVTAGSLLVTAANGLTSWDANVLKIGATTTTGVQIGPGVVGTTGTPTTALITQAIHTGGAATIFKVTGAAIVGQDASTEISDVVWDLSRTVTIKTGALTLQRQVVFDVQTTLAFVGASVVATAVGMHISAGPTKGGNAEITSTVGVYIGGVGATGAAATTTVVSAAGARFAQMLFSDDTVSFLGGTGVTATNAPISSMSLGQLTVTGDTATCTVANAATLYIKGAPIAGQNVALTKTYAILCDAGLCRFDGDGTRVFELPADATGNVSAATGRIPILIGAATQYLRYYAD